MWIPYMRPLREKYYEDSQPDFSAGMTGEGHVSAERREIGQRFLATIDDVIDMEGRRLWLDVPELEDVASLVRFYSRPQEHTLLFVPTLSHQRE
jgi:hypothetical protein